MNKCPKCGSEDIESDCLENQLAAVQKTVDFERKMVERQSVKLAAVTAERDELRRMLDAVLALEEPVEKALRAEISRLREALGRIAVYCNDTLSGPADGTPQDALWYKVAVAVARNRAQAALKGVPNADPR